MSAGKQFDRFATIITVLMVVVCLVFMNGSVFGIQAAATTMGYENRLFDQSRVHTLDLVMDDWDDFIATAASEDYASASVIIDGEPWKNVGIRAKGNTSLSTVSSMDSDRYSFKIEFDHYEKGKTYHGLDKLSLNNLIQDTTMMKDYLTYTMINEMGAVSPLCSYVYMTVNGEDWGLYLAVEGIEESFLERNYGSDYGDLYKPDSMSFGAGRGNGAGFDMNDFDFTPPDQSDSSDSDPASSATSTAGKPAMPGGNGQSMPEAGGGEMPDPGNGEMPDFGNGEMPLFGNGEMPDFSGGEIPEPPTMDNAGKGGQGMMGGMGSDDVKLQYIDDDPDSYSNIWNNAKTDVTEKDQQRLIESLKKLSSLEDLESVVDVDGMIRYFVVHNYVCNGDSYTGNMIHNYYLYEKDGQMSMLPWDYNLAFGTFNGSQADETINTPIDSPVSGSSEDRPMLNWIFENEEYTSLYHELFQEFLNTVDMQSVIEEVHLPIQDYVAKDPNAFYTSEEFEQGVETLKSFCSLRSESIQQQLENSQTTENMHYVDASDLNLSDMGTMNHGAGQKGMEFGKDRMPDAENGTNGDQSDQSEGQDEIRFNPCS